MKIVLSEFERPHSPCAFEDIQHILATNGRELVKTAYSVLPQTQNGRIYESALAEWFVCFFNLVRDEGNGTKCVNAISSMGLIKASRDGGYWSNV